MSHMSSIVVEMENLKADITSLQNRVLVERDISDYWYERCQKLEAKLNDALNNRLPSDAGK